jgi:hypothetical protein
MGCAQMGGGFGIALVAGQCQKIFQVVPIGVFKAHLVLNLLEKKAVSFETYCFDSTNFVSLM